MCVVISRHGAVACAALHGLGTGGHNVIYQCEDGLCGSCWHLCEQTGDVYQLLLGRSTSGLINDAVPAYAAVSCLLALSSTPLTAAFGILRCIESTTAADLPSKARTCARRSFASLVGNEVAYLSHFSWVGLSKSKKCFVPNSNGLGGFWAWGPPVCTMDKKGSHVSPARKTNKHGP